MKYTVIENKNVTLYVDEVITIRNKQTGKVAKLTLGIDECAESPRSYSEHMFHIVSSGLNWNISDKGYNMSYNDFVLLLIKTLSKKHPSIAQMSDVESILGVPGVDDDIICKPIYMYDHSGQTISLTPFGCKWDSGLCGYAFCTKQDVLLYNGQLTDETWKDYALSVLDAEIEEYDAYIRGDVYYWEMFEYQPIECRNTITGEVYMTEERASIDSCGPYYTDSSTKILEDALGNDWEVVEEIKEG